MNLDNVLARRRRLPDLGITHRRTGDLHRRLGARASDRLDRVRHADPPRALAARARGRAALEDHAGQRPLPDRRGARRPARPSTSAARRKVFVEYVMLAGVNDTLRAGRPARRAARPARLQGQPDPVQPDRRAYDGSSRGAIDAFKAALEEHGLRATVPRLARAPRRWRASARGRSRRLRSRLAAPRSALAADAAGAGALARPRAAGGRAAPPGPRATGPTARARAAPRASAGRTA